MQIIDRVLRFSGVAVLGFATLVTVLSMLVIVTHWDGVLLFLFGS